MFTKVLVPLDGSALAERAMLPALALAREPGAQVALFRVAYPEQPFIPSKSGAEPRGWVWPEQALAHSRREAQSYLTAVQAAYASPECLIWPKIASEDTTNPDVAARILEFAQAEHCEVIVMSSHGRSGLGRWMYGSVAERVLSVAPCPVLMVRSEKPIQHVLIPLDGSPLAEQVVPAAMTLAARLGCSVTLLQVIPHISRITEGEGHLTYHFYGAGTAREELPTIKTVPESLQSNLRDGAWAYLNRLLAPYAHLKLPTQAVVEAGSTAETILAFAETHLVDCIAMATHGRTGFLRWVYGSVTDKVLRGSSTSMLISRSAQH